MKIRGFECVSYRENILLPKRSTILSAGYDFFSIEDCVIPTCREGNCKPFLIPTGIKAYMQDNEFLQLCNRSSNPIKNQLIMPNGVGVIDSDYYNNEENEGHIFFQFLNIGSKEINMKKGDKIGQGIFLPFLKADNDFSDEERLGGFGSTGV